MKTIEEKALSLPIEERIEEIAIEVGNNCVDFYGHEVDFSYIEYGLRQIATEQRAIDDKECETMVGVAVKKMKQVFIDKACEWLDSQLYTDDGGYLVSEKYQQLDEFIQGFRKAMEK